MWHSFRCLLSASFLRIYVVVIALEIWPRISMKMKKKTSRENQLRKIDYLVKSINDNLFIQHQLKWCMSIVESPSNYKFYKKPWTRMKKTNEWNGMEAYSDSKKNYHNTMMTFSWLVNWCKWNARAFQMCIWCPKFETLFLIKCNQIVKCWRKRRKKNISI